MTSNDSLSEETLAPIRQLFFQECEDHLAGLESGLAALCGGGYDAETVNTIFRAVHSIKGGAATFAFDFLVRFSHSFENALNELRTERVKSDPVLLKLFLTATDCLADLVRSARSGEPHNEELARTIAGKLEAIVHRGDDANEWREPVGAPDAFPFEPVAIDPSLFGISAPKQTARWKIDFRPHAAMYFKANDPLFLLRELQDLGAMTVRLNDAKLPSLDGLEPEESYLAWTVYLSTDADEKTIREVFEFTEEDCDLRIALEPVAFAEALRQTVPENPATTTLVERSASPGQGATLATTVRVDLARVDRLVNLVSEMVITQGTLTEQMSTPGSAQRQLSMLACLDILGRLTREIQESVLVLRAQPVKIVFQRMPRLMRELETITGKQVRLVLEGEDTEVDKTVIEHLTDPITHMIRNAVDHGVEMPQDREAAGKPVVATIRLSATHRSGRIVIQISDDGKGIDRARVLAIAKSRGLVGDQALNEAEIDELIFMPGFSTAEGVSDLSGRGVGMDVVRRSIQSLNGRISILSDPGKGTTFVLSLPLTLAILDGMVVSVGGHTLVVPIASISEALQPLEANLRKLGPYNTLIAVRDTYVPIIDVGQAMGYTDHPADPLEGVVLLVEGENGEMAALLVSLIEGQKQVVIKSIRDNYKTVKGVSAATILGDGRVAFIVDTDVLISSRQNMARLNPYLAKAG